MLFKIVFIDLYIVIIGCFIGDYIRLISIVFLFVVIYRIFVSYECMGLENYFLDLWKILYMYMYFLLCSIFYVRWELGYFVLKL